MSDDAGWCVYATDDEFIDGVSSEILRSPLAPTSGLPEAPNTLNSIQVVLLLIRSLPPSGRRLLTPLDFAVTLTLVLSLFWVL